MNTSNVTNNLTWEYISGFFDGEGCIFFMKRNYIRSSKYVMMHISQCEKHEEESHIIENIYKFLLHNGIKARWVKYGKVKEGWFSANRVIVSNAAGCKEWINHMLPFLRVKKIQAITALKHISEFDNPNLDNDSINKILELRKQRMSLRKISRITGFNRATVTRYIYAFPSLIIQRKIESPKRYGFK